MQLPPNRFRQRLADGGPLFGLWLGLPDPSCAEICAGSGFDWLLIDGEHAPFDVNAVMRHLQAIARFDVPVLVRPVDGNPALLKQLLDVGVQSLLVPMVESAEQAARIARAVRYPPGGTRGLGTSLSRAAQWNRIPDYLHAANAEICLVVQVETVAALAALPDIVAVDGVDGVFVGPSDLSASMGYIGSPAHPEVVLAVERALGVIRAGGRAAGVLAVDQALAERYIAAGAQFIGVGVDTTLLANAAAGLAARWRGAAVTDTPGVSY